MKNQNQITRWAIDNGTFIPQGEKANWRILADAHRYTHPLFGQVVSGITDGLFCHVATTGRGLCHVTLGQMSRGAEPEENEIEENEIEMVA